ncbi:hypothetical protein ACLB2K_064170 [Fragaria x ananassa]
MSCYGSRGEERNRKQERLAVARETELWVPVNNLWVPVNNLWVMAGGIRHELLWICSWINYPADEENPGGFLLTITYPADKKKLGMIMLLECLSR